MPELTIPLEPGATAAVLGALLADALGVPHEFKEGYLIPHRDELHLVMPAGYNKTYGGVPYGLWSDDGSQLLCLLASLHESQGRFSVDDFAQRLLAWWRAGYMQAGGNVFDIGGQTARALGKLRMGMSPEESGGIDTHSNGNGSLMRCLPAGLMPALWGADLRAVVATATAQSRVTHAHPLSQVTCALYAYLVATLDAPPESWRQAAFEACDQLADLLEDPRLLVALGDLRAHAQELPNGGGFVLDAFWSAIWALDQGRGYLDTVTYAVTLGRDTDTTACIAGGLAGKVYPLDAPAVWWRDLVVPDEARQLLARLTEHESA